MESEAYNREQVKAQLQELEQKIARIEAGEKPEANESLEGLHAQYEALQSQLLDKAA